MTNSLPRGRVLNCGFVFLYSVKCDFFLFNVCDRLSRTSQLPRICHSFQTFLLLKFFNEKPQDSLETVKLLQRHLGVKLIQIKGEMKTCLAWCAEKERMFQCSFLSIRASYHLSV